MSLYPYTLLIVHSVYDLKRLREVGQLHNHSGNITVVAFAGSGEARTHMISGSSDGMMCLWQCKDWTCLNTIHVHQGNVVSLALHPSSRLALSVGDDKFLKIWNLLTGKLSTSLTLDHIPSQVLFNPSGTLFVIVFPLMKQIVVYNIEGTVVRTLEFPHKISTAVFLNDHIVAAAGDGGSIGVWDTGKGFLHAIQLNTDARFKVLVAIPPINHLLKNETEDQFPYVLAACSTGLILILSLSTGDILASTETNARLTCASISLVTKGPSQNNVTQTQTQTKRKIQNSKSTNNKKQK